MTDDILIRTAGPIEAGILVELRGRMLIELGDDDPCRLAELARVSIEWSDVALADGRLAGWIAAAEKARPIYERLGFKPTSEMRIELAENAPRRLGAFGANGGLPGCRRS